MNGGIINTCCAGMILCVWHPLALDNNKTKSGSISLSYDRS